MTHAVVVGEDCSWLLCPKLHLLFGKTGGQGMVEEEEEEDEEGVSMQTESEMQMNQGLARGQMEADGEEDGGEEDDGEDDMDEDTHMNGSN